MPNKEIIGVILAAGKSTRMNPFSAHYPKPALPILNKPVLYHQLLQLKALDVTEVIIVVSHLGFEIVRHLERSPIEGMNITYIDQGETLGIAHAVGKLEREITSPFILMLGDIYFISNGLDEALRIFEQSDINAVLVSKLEQNTEAIKRNFAILLAEDGSVKRVIEKPRYVENNVKGCGIYLFDLHIFDAIRRTPRTAMRDEYEITDSIQILINDGFRVEHVPAVQEDMNLTYPSDILDINRFELNRLGLDNFIDAGAFIAPHTTLKGCVIGAGVNIDSGVSLTDCTVFDNTVIAAGTQASQAIFTPYQAIQCSENLVHFRNE